MGVISPYETHGFKSAEFIFSKVKRELHSYEMANLIDDGEFPKYVNEVLRALGIGVYKELPAVIQIEDYKGKMPNDFAVLYAAYKCTPTFGSKDLVHPQGNGISIYNDVTWELLKGGQDCEIEPIRNCDRVIERIEVRQYVKEHVVPHSLVNPILLRLSPNVKHNQCSNDCENLLASSPFEITIADGYLYTNFASDAVFMKYYGIPKDENGIPLIPDLEYVEKAIEWYIKYQLLMGWWMNNQVPDLQNRWQYAEAKYEKYLAEAKHERKIPSFARMVNWARRKRNTQALFVYAQIDNNGYWQKH